MGTVSGSILCCSRRHCHCVKREVKLPVERSNPQSEKEPCREAQIRKNRHHWTMHLSLQNLDPIDPLWGSVFVTLRMQKRQKQQLSIPPFLDASYPKKIQKSCRFRFLRLGCFLGFVLLGLLRCSIKKKVSREKHFVYS